MSTLTCAAPGTVEHEPGLPPNRATAPGHCPWIALFGASTSAGAPARRMSSTPSNVLPEPGGATTCVRNRPAARSASKASIASDWYRRHVPSNSASTRPPYVTMWAVDPYDVLGIAPDASDEEAARAYRELAKRYHPDRAGERARRRWPSSTPPTTCCAPA